MFTFMTLHNVRGCCGEGLEPQSRNLLLLHKEVFRRTVELWRVRHVPAREDGGGEGRLGLSSGGDLPVEVSEDVNKVELHGPLGGEVDRHVAGVVV